MNRLKKLWSLTAICGMMIGIFPMSIFAETIEEASVVVNEAAITDMDDQAITEDQRSNHKDSVKVKLSWSLAKAALIEANTMMSVALPANLTYPDQSGSLGEMGNYQVSNQQLIFQFNKNYQETEDGRAPDFASAKFYEGLIELTAETTSEELETENVDFGNNIISTLYYDKKVDPAADPVNAETDSEQKIQSRAHNPNLNDRGVDLFNNIKITDLAGNEFSAANPAVKDADIKIHFDWALDNDETNYKVTVTVKEEAGELKATAVYENVKAGEVPIFKNVYKVLPTDIQLEAKKELSGRPIKADEFSFNLKGESIDQTVKNDGNGKVTFDKIDYDKAGTYEYTISEVIPTEKETGMTYDETEYKVTVTVEEKAGKLEAVAKYEGTESNEIPTFKNSFTPEKEVPAGEILLKKLDSKTGRTLAEAEFKVVDEKGQPVAGQEKIVTGEDGSIFIKGLTDGNYQLIETKAPKGYQIDETPIEFSVKNSQPSKKEINQKNDPIGLPETGKTNNQKTNVQTTYRNTGGTSSTTAKRLPSTGSIRSNGLIMLGLFFLAMIGLVAFSKRKKA